MEEQATEEQTTSQAEGAAEATPAPEARRAPRRASRRDFFKLAGAAGAGVVVAGAAGAGAAAYLGGRQKPAVSAYREPPARLNPPPVLTLSQSGGNLPSRDPYVRAAHLLRRAGFGYTPAE